MIDKLLTTWWWPLPRAETCCCAKLDSSHPVVYA